MCSISHIPYFMSIIYLVLDSSESREPQTTKPPLESGRLAAPSRAKAQPNTSEQSPITELPHNSSWCEYSLEITTLHTDEEIGALKVDPGLYALYSRQLTPPSSYSHVWLTSLLSISKSQSRTSSTPSESPIDTTTSVIMLTQSIRASVWTVLSF